MKIRYATNRAAFIVQIKKLRKIQSIIILIKFLLMSRCKFPQMEFDLLNGYAIRKEVMGLKLLS